ncbi:GNAT family N-acetyltransferase [Pseudanabaena yagii]|uniref:GNAT family N-acetyltransferase n=1 Tax=Pseudanabaena yagii GIHE-NHR1 TaxID=2722753 RepID=A0ABX1M2A7_9CYAN|nr:GNAT family N-acetyltransferase [Pseudanabaena yagii]NMF61029.1 GNAT family N-acetyltransferase [Pseudanabaena yagii GIHE-NHR1]
MILRIANVNDIPAIAKVHVDTWRTAYHGIIPDEHLENMSYEHREKMWHQVLRHPNNYFVYVVEDDFGQIVGFASGGLERTDDRIYLGELTAIYVLQSHQKQKIGHRLVGAVAERLAQLDIHSMLIWALADNPACNFYKALGGQQVYEKEVEIGGKQLIEVAFGWLDTASLCSLSSSRI